MQLEWTAIQLKRSASIASDLHRSVEWCCSQQKNFDQLKNFWKHNKLPIYKPIATIWANISDFRNFNHTINLDGYLINGARASLQSHPGGQILEDTSIVTSLEIMTSKSSITGCNYCYWSCAIIETSIEINRKNHGAFGADNFCFTDRGYIPIHMITR